MKRAIGTLLRWLGWLFVVGAGLSVLVSGDWLGAVLGGAGGLLFIGLGRALRGREPSTLRGLGKG